FWLLNAPYVAVFQLLIYAGAIVALFVAAVMLTTRKESVR
ncbi:NADH-quinone oxidoreductase subunit J, partial [Candidatus Bathyarchaeota archaeon]